MSDDTVQPITPPSQPAQPEAPEENIEEKLDEVALATKQKLHEDATLSQTLGTTPDIQEMVVDIERDLLEEIIKRLDTDKMSPDDAQKLAQEFLSFLPIQDKKDLLEKLLKLSHDNSATQSIYLKYAKPYEENERQRKLTLMSQHLQQGNIEEALSVAKGGTTNA
jgi:uncharacterized membrane-anchored protein YjiN (DUF445 family)